MTQADSSVRVDVLGVHVSAINLEIAVDTIAGWIRDRRRTYVCVTGAHGVIESQRDPILMAIHNESGLTTPDGMPLVWASRSAGVSGVDRVYGPDLTLALAERGAAEGWKAFAYGGAEGVAEAFGQTLETRHPGFEFVGSYCPPFRPLTEPERREVIDTINASGADLVFVGLSTPKQERWMGEMREHLDPPVLLGVGAAFDFHTGRTRQAPRWIQRCGLEWAFRAATEPKRLGRRYATIVPKLLIGVARRRPFIVPEPE